MMDILMKLLANLRQQTTSVKFSETKTQKERLASIFREADTLSRNKSIKHTMVIRRCFMRDISRILS